MKKTIVTITPIKIFRMPDGKITRSVNRIDLQLASLRAQKGDFEIRPIVSDMSEDPHVIDALQKICEKHSATYINTKSSLIFNKALCLNVAIKSVPKNVQYIATLDADIIYREDVFQKCLDLVDNGKNFVLSQTFMYKNEMMAPDFSEESFSAVKDDGEFLHIVGNGGLQFFPREWLQKVRGYDERFNLWGGPDNEMAERAAKAGLKPKWVSRNDKDIYLIHLAHARYQIPGVSIEFIAAYRKQYNHKIFIDKQIKVVANPDSWGEEANIVGPRFKR